MIITHSLEAKDYVQFNLFQIEHTEKLKKRLQIQRIVVSTVFTVIALFSYSLLSGFRLTVGAIFLGISLLWYGYFPIFSRNQVMKSTEKTIASGQLASLFDEVRLEFDDEGVKEVTTQGEHSAGWQDIQSICLTQEYLYLFLTSASAIIVPKRTLADAELDDLEMLIGKHYQGKIEYLDT